jgi:hypothetical protein
MKLHQASILTERIMDIMAKAFFTSVEDRIETIALLRELYNDELEDGQETVEATFLLACIRLFTDMD